MLAFTFPGQGSQQPGMGRPWVDHPSWELVEEASTPAGATSPSCCSTPTPTSCTDTAQRPALHLRARASSCSTPSSARRRAELLRRPQPRRVHRAHRRRRAGASTTACASSPSAATRCRTPPTSGRARWPPSSALDDDQVDVACRRADRRRVGGQLQRARPGRDRRRRRGRRRRRACIAKELGARR